MIHGTPSLLRIGTANVELAAPYLPQKKQRGATQREALLGAIVQMATKAICTTETS